MMRGTRGGLLFRNALLSLHIWNRKRVVLFWALVLFSTYMHAWCIYFVCLSLQLDPFKIPMLISSNNKSLYILIVSKDHF